MKKIHRYLLGVALLAFSTAAQADMHYYYTCGVMIAYQIKDKIYDMEYIPTEKDLKIILPEIERIKSGVSQAYIIELELFLGDSHCA